MVFVQGQCLDYVLYQIVDIGEVELFVVVAFQQQWLVGQGVLDENLIDLVGNAVLVIQCGGVNDCGFQFILCVIGMNQLFIYEFGIGIDVFWMGEGGFVNTCFFEIAIDGGGGHEYDLVDVLNFWVDQFQYVVQCDQLQVKGQIWLYFCIDGAGDGGHMDDLGWLKILEDMVQIGQQACIVVYQCDIAFS